MLHKPAKCKAMLWKERVNDFLIEFDIYFRPCYTLHIHV